MTPNDDSPVPFDIFKEIERVTAALYPGVNPREWCSCPVGLCLKRDDVHCMNIRRTGYP